MRLRDAMKGLLVAFGLVSTSVALAQPAEHRRLVGARTELGVEQVARDVLVIEGRMEVRGTIQGHLYAVDSDLFIRSSAIVLDSLTVVGGSLHLEPGAVLPAVIDLRGTDYYGPGSEKLRAKGFTELKGGTTRVQFQPAESSTTAAALARLVLPFDRFTPPERATISNLADWSPALGLDEVDLPSRSDGAMKLAGLLELRIVSDRVVGTLQRGFRGSRGKVLLTVLELESEDSAGELWEALRAA